MRYTTPIFAIISFAHELQRQKREWKKSMAVKLFYCSSGKKSFSLRNSAAIQLQINSF